MITKIIGISEFPHIETKTEADIAQKIRRDFFFVLQKPEFIHNFGKTCKGLARTEPAPGLNRGGKPPEA
jgi:hypothetical protein